MDPINSIVFSLCMYVNESWTYDDRWFIKMLEVKTRKLSEIWRTIEKCYSL